MSVQSADAAVLATQLQETEISQAVFDYVMKNFGEPISLEDLERALGWSCYRICRAFHRECGVTPMRWIWAFRVNLAAEFVAHSPDRSLTEIAFFCGFNSSAHFSQSFRRAFGVRPTDYRKAATQAAANPTVASPDLLQQSQKFMAKAAVLALA